MLHWNANPDFLHFGVVTIRWYGLCFAAAFFCGLHIMKHIYRQENRPLEELDSLLLMMVLGTIIGARVGHCLFYEPDYYLRHPLHILMVWEGGLASHGGLAGILTTVWYFARKHNVRYLWILDRLVIPTALGGAFIRVGNFMNSEILGIPTSMSWGIIFDRVDPLPRHPVQLYEALAYFSIFLLLFFTYLRVPLTRVLHGRLLGQFLVLVFGCRFFLEFFKIPQAAYAQTLPLSVGQTLSIPCILTGLYLMASAKKKIPASLLKQRKH